MNNWLRWLKGDNYLSSKSPVAVFGRFILSVWIAIIVICGLIIGGIFLVSPENFSTPKHDTTCTTVEHNGEAIDTCDYLTP
jgi:hypothetical protein